MDENNVNGFDNSDDDEGTTVLTTPGVNAYAASQGSRAEQPQGGMYSQFSQPSQPQYGQPDMSNQGGMYGQFSQPGQPQYGQPDMSNQGGMYGQFSQPSQPQYGQPDMSNQGGMYGQFSQPGQPQYGQPGQSPYGQPGQQYGQTGFNPNQTPGSKGNGAAGIVDKLKHMNKALLIGIGGGVIALIILLIVLLAVLGGRGSSSIDKMGEKLASAYEKDDENIIIKQMHEEVYSAATTDVGMSDKEAREEFKDYLEEEIGAVEGVVGEIKEIKIDDIDKEYYDKEEIADAEKELREDYDIDLDISGFVEARAEITVEGKDDTADGTLRYSAMKVGNKWYLTYYYIRVDEE